MTMVSRTALVLPLVAALGLSACDRPSQGTSITVNGADGDTLASVDGKSGRSSWRCPASRARSSCPRCRWMRTISN
ncbi:hypothetical protein P0F65_18860 [Sphingomonas sp. I4]